MTLTTINWGQFNELLNQLDKRDWLVIGLGIFSQFLAVAVAAYSGYYFQKKSKKIEIDLSKRIEAYRFDEAVAYISVLLEDMASYTDQLALKNYFREKEKSEEIAKCLEMLRNGKIQGIGSFTASFLSMRKLPITKPEDVISKIPDVGRYLEVLRAFHRMKGAILQCNSACEERDFLIKELIASKIR